MRSAGLIMYFVLKQVREPMFAETFERNVRLGGFRTPQGARNAAKKFAPAIIRNEMRITLGQTVSPSLPLFVGA
jgi:hypothetical protein